MAITYPTATDLAYENAEGTQCRATINGKQWSGITEKSRHWPSVQKALDEGAVPEPYVAPPEPDPNLQQIRRIMERQALIIHDVFKQLAADGVLNVNGQHITQQSRDDFANLQTYVSNLRS